MKSLDGITAEKAAECAKPLVSAVGNLIAVNGYDFLTRRTIPTPIPSPYPWKFQIWIKSKSLPIPVREIGLEIGVVLSVSENCIIYTVRYLNFKFKLLLFSVKYRGMGSMTKCLWQKSHIVQLHAKVLSFEDR